MVKPEKEIFHLMLKRYHLEVSSCLFIDDSLKNIDAAKKLGFSTIHVQEKTDLRNELLLLGIL